MLGTKILSMAESQQASNLLNNFDFTAIDEMDPSLSRLKKKFTKQKALGKYFSPTIIQIFEKI
jgi:hypothetical protein